LQSPISSSKSLISQPHLQETPLTTLSLDPRTLAHVVITLIAILSGLVVLAALTRGRLPGGWNGVFLAFTFLTSLTGFVFFHPSKTTPAQVTGVVALLVLAPTVYALVLARLTGAWRIVFVVGATISLYLNVFVLVVQLFLKLPSALGRGPAITGGPLFGAVQGLVLLAFVGAGWLAVRRFRPLKF
jgi:hypothetical protein